MDKLFMSIFVYYDVIVIMAFLSFIIIRYFYYHVCLFVWFQSASKTNEPANSLTVLRIKQREREINKAQFIHMSQLTEMFKRIQNYLLSPTRIVTHRHSLCNL